VGGFLLIAPIWLTPWIMPTEPWWKQTAIHGGADPRYPSPASEPVLAAQRELLDDALSNLDDERPNVSDLYFVGFAGDAREDVFRKDVIAAQQVMDERWGTDGRSIALINNRGRCSMRPANHEPARPSTRSARRSLRTRMS
jgi:hypothetical protein